MKLYKKIQNTFGGSGLYLGKAVLAHLGILTGDEVVLDLVVEDGVEKVIITKSGLNNVKIQKIIDTNR